MLNFGVPTNAKFLFAKYVILSITTSFFRELKSSISDLDDHKISTYIHIHIQPQYIHEIHTYVYKHIRIDSNSNVYYRCPTQVTVPLNTYVCTSGNRYRSTLASPQCLHKNHPHKSYMHACTHPILLNHLLVVSHSLRISIVIPRLLLPWWSVWR